MVTKMERIIIKSNRNSEVVLMTKDGREYDLMLEIQGRKTLIANMIANGTKEETKETINEAIKNSDWKYLVAFI
jgi:hypothetical protein